ncbi:MAG: hypothetical protein K0S32_543 [Bacteroidetes bacterium]|nr:hypothetical protein [Bacteroidota bacterium]
MIVSQARHPSVFNSVCAIVLICLCSLPYYTNKGAGFHFDKFGKVFSISLLLCSPIVLYITSTKRKIIIDGNTIEVQEKFGFRKIVFDASEITGMTWGGSPRKISWNQRTTKATIGNRNCLIIFKDGSELEVDDYNYKNCEEIMAWFFSYCRYQGIINVEAMEKRKKERSRRRNKS